MKYVRSLAWMLPALLLTPVVTRAALPSKFTMSQVIHYPYAAQLAAAEQGDVIAWVRSIEGVRNIWIARGPAFTPLQMTQYAEDDGQEITQLTFSPDGTRLVFVRGGDRDSNWPAEGNLAPDPTSSPEQPVAAIWTVPLTGEAPQKIDEGGEPVISARGQLAYIKEHHVWSSPLGDGKPERLFFDRGKNGELRWSPDGSRLAFVSERGDHSFIGIFTSKNAPLIYLAPSTDQDSSPRWSPDGRQVAFTRRAGDGGAPDPILTQSPHRWSIWVASVNGGAGHAVWRSPNTLAGSYLDVAGEANLHWAAGERLVFMAYLDDWPHLYSVPTTGGTPILLILGELPARHRLWPNLPSARSCRLRRGRRISGRSGGRAFSANAFERRREAHRYLGRLVWRLSDGARACAQFGSLQGRSRPARRARLVAADRRGPANR